MKQPFFALALIGGLLAPCVAHAQGVMVLGVRSVEGDDEFTRNLTGALRHAASQVESWQVSDREVTLSQMALAHGCDEPDSTCMSAIADSLEAPMVIYGDVRRSATGAQFDFQINLHFFNSQTDEIEHSVAETVPGSRQDIDDLREPARRWIAALSGAPRSGTLTVQVNVPGADVLIDGASVGHANAEGFLQVENVQAGNRNVQIVAPGHATFRSSVSVEAYGQATFEAELQAGGGGGSFPVDTVLGVVFLAVGAGLGAGSIYSIVRIDAINSDPLYLAVREAFSRDIENVCAEPTGAAIRDDQTAFCNEAATLEVLQFALGIGAVAAAGVGLYFLVSGASGGGSEETQAFLLTPSIGPDHAYLGALVRF